MLKDHHSGFHLIFQPSDRAAPAPATPSSTDTTSSSTNTNPNVGNTPFNLGSLGGLAGMENMGMGSPNFAEMQQRMQREVIL